jgi:hypothetical protein
MDTFNLNNVEQNLKQNFISHFLAKQRNTQLHSETNKHFQMSAILHALKARAAASGVTSICSVVTVILGTATDQIII